MRLETSSIKELANAHRMGHTCANLKGELLFIWGGSDESVAYLPVKNNHLWIYDTLSGYWRHRLCTGECPPYLSGATSCLIGQRMFVFGGHSTAQDNWMNSLYCLDLDTFDWQDVGSAARAEPTKPIRADKLVSWAHAGRLYVFGGYGWSQTEHLLELLDRQRDLQLAPDHRWPKFGWNNQLVEFNPRDSTWRWPSYSGRCPSARAAHSGALMGSTYYLFGGRDCRERLNDLYSLDMNTLTWSQIATFSASPGLPLDRLPMRHLLEPAEAVDGDGGAAAGDENRPASGGEAEAQAAVMQADAEDLMTPSPSSSGAFRVSHQEPEQPEEEDSDSNDSDADYPFDFTHPSHLLERWSLSSASSTRRCPSSSSLAPTETGDNEGAESDCGGAATDGPSELHSRLQNCHSSSTCRPAGAPQQERQMDQVQAAENQQEEQQPLNDNYAADDDDDDGDGSEQPPTIASCKEPAKPAGRSFASFTPISEREILLYGGINSLDENLGDCWIFNISTNQWTWIDLKNTNQPRLWHTGARTKNNEVVIIGGSCSDKIDEICTDILSISLTPKSLKRLALDAAARSIRMRTVNRAKGLPSTVGKLIRLRKQAISLSARRFYTTAYSNASANRSAAPPGSLAQPIQL